ncbi:hypothetical protein [Pseudomonas cerasi]
MSMNLREKLKEAQRKSELKNIKNLIITETHLQEKDINCNNIKYQRLIDIFYDKLTLKKDFFDTSSEMRYFEGFFSENLDEEITFMVKTKANVFFLSLPYISIRNNLVFFWDEDRILSQSDDKIFFNHSLSKGFIMLMSEYGVETALW